MSYSSDPVLDEMRHSEPISGVVLNAALQALKKAASIEWNSTPQQRGAAAGACANAEVWLEAEMKRVGVLS